MKPIRQHVTPWFRSVCSFGPREPGLSSIMKVRRFAAINALWFALMASSAPAVAQSDAVSRAPPPAPPPLVAVDKGRRAESSVLPGGSNLGGLISQDDYPPDALDANEQGTVSVRLDIDSSGKPSGCIVLSGSGSKSLDEQTCKLLLKRAKYLPGRDRQGNPVAGSVTGRVRWVLKDPSMPSAPWMLRSTVVVDGSSGKSLCSVDAEGAVAGHEELIWGCKDILRDFPAELVAQVSPGAAVSFINEERFIPDADDAPPAAADRNDEMTVARVVLRLSIDQAGAVTSCQVASWDGEGPKPDKACPPIDMDFMPRRGPNGQAVPYKAILIQRAAIRQRSETASVGAAIRSDLPDTKGAS